MPNKMNISISVGESNPVQKKTLTLEQTISLIKLKSYPKETEDALIKILKKNPSNTYEQFLKNIYLHLNRIQQSKKKNPD